MSSSLFSHSVLVFLVATQAAAIPGRVEGEQSANSEGLRSSPRGTAAILQGSLLARLVGAGCGLAEAP